MIIHRDINEVSPGSVLASDILGASGHILAGSGAVLTPKQLRVLKAHGIAQITIQTHSLTLLSNNAATSAEPQHMLEIFRYSNALHPLIKELIRLHELRTGHLVRGLCTHDH